jgi:hypothetical protein
MSKYDKLDALIVEAIKNDPRSPIYDRACDQEASRIADPVRRDSFRVIDGRMTALKKQGRIAYLSKAKSPSVA